MLWIDLETYNAETDISAGTHAYAETAEVLLVAYALGKGPVSLWDCGTRAEMPGALKDALGDPAVLITAHNAPFDRTVLRLALGVETDITRWRCTLAKALTHGFPGALDKLGTIFGLPQDQAKLKAGKRLIQRFSKPAPKNHKADRYDRSTHPDDWARFCDYAMRDIEAMRALDRRLPDWNYRRGELGLWHLDQTINDRGIAIDRDLVAAGRRAADAEKQALGARFAALTGGAVTRPTQREAFRRYLNDTFGLDLANTQSATFRDILSDPDRAVPDTCAELMQISIAANKSSTAKYKALDPAISRDGRFRGGLQFAGAARTRRWSGKVFQPHNLSSRGLPPQRSIDQYIRALKAGTHDILFDDLMLYGSAALRGVLVAPKGKRLVIADLSNIEGRIAAWLAGETWKLEAFAAYDRGCGPDLYRVAAGRMLGKPVPAVTEAERNGLGKVAELALGYAGGVGAIQNFAKGKMEALLPVIQAAAPQAVARARENYDAWGFERAGETCAMEWVASDAVKLAWRDRHPAIATFWHACEAAARKAIQTPGAAFRAGRHVIYKVMPHAGHRYLLAKMPSGQFLTYFDPRITADGTLTHMGVNSLTKQWERQDTYGGRLAENLCQSLARDILAQSLPRIEAAGFAIVLTVHDEVVTEAPVSNDLSAERLAAIMAEGPDWAPGLPLAAAGFVAERYRK